MVQNTGKTLYTDAYKPINIPELVLVEEDASGLPVAVKLPRRQIITTIEDRWRLDDEWWRTESISRFYYTVLLVRGERLMLYKDLINGQWYRQSH